MKKICDWFIAHWRVLVGIAVWAAIVSIIFFQSGLDSQPRLSLSDKIQAMSVITLVFITWFYAVQTQRLVKEQKNAIEEERKKRSAEFGVERIENFLRPLLQHLDDLKDSVSQIAAASKRPLEINFDNSLSIFQARLNVTKEFFIEYLFMTDSILRFGYLKITKMTMPKSIENQ